MGNTETSFPETSEPVTDGKVTARVDDKSSSPKSGKKEHLKRFRKDNPRIDYYPSEEAEAAIAATHKANPKHPTRSIIDFLIVKGFKTVSGNTQG